MLGNWLGNSGITSDEKHFRKSWETPRKVIKNQEILGKTWKSDEHLGISWEHPEKILENSWNHVEKLVKI